MKKWCSKLANNKITINNILVFLFYILKPEWNLQDKHYWCFKSDIDSKKNAILTSFVSLWSCLIFNVFPNSCIYSHRIPLSITCTLYIKIGFVVAKQGRIAGKASDERKKQHDDARRRRIIMVSHLQLYCHLFLWGTDTNVLKTK